ncbi:hypothetical protein G4977_14955 [[Ruminococcus] gnavus]|nr:hypothetical protein [Mediterraneibacter gnavus]NSH79510.1 hypothetical protein [Mediterraneibacter gnavus]NSH83165.1 hypothetical protein [Mediterraneibacter gnavus]NSH86822.1 hypothetical protein [Mediterraneibacter gnavus]NSH98667.1 hypothetical protein [Mediterraneibacter gnavus]
MLESTEKGGVRNSIHNCLTVFQYDPILSGAVAKNLLTERIDLLKPIGRKRRTGSKAMTDTDMKYIRLYLEDTYGLTSEKKIADAADLAADANSYHPIRDYLSGLVKQALSYSQRHNRKVVFAYLLLPGINDRSSDIRQLAKWFKGKNVMINVLQYNPTSNSKIRAPQKQEMVAFKHQLEQTGLEVTMRVSHGREIKAACGQLANTYNKAKKQQK